MSLFDWINRLAWAIAFAWTISASILAWAGLFSMKRPEVARWFFHELRPFYLPAVVLHVGYLSAHDQILGWNTLWATLSLINWWGLKDVDDDDDRWKRRRRKVAEKIARIGGRLAVVPAGSGTR